MSNAPLSLFGDATEGEVAEVLARLLTPQNRQLMLAIRDRKPDSVAKLAKLTHRAPPNVKRTLDKLAALGLVSFRTEGRKKAPRMVAKKITIEMDPFSTRDRIIVTPAVKAAPLRPRAL